MKIVIGCDHAGFALKQVLKEWIAGEVHTVTDIGCDTIDRCDYPDFGIEVGRCVVSGNADRGILVCGSGIGVCISANRIKGVRAAVLRIEEDAQLSRQHNDANVACLGARITDPEKAQKLLQIFLTTEFEGGRHQGRIEKLDRL